VLGADAVPPWISGLYHYAWFVGFLVSGTVYLAMMKRPVNASRPVMATTT
jgi:NCS1 family nucleobase:cation symporter-1